MAKATPGRGRPGKLTPEIQDKIAAAIRAGDSATIAAEYARVLAEELLNLEIRVDENANDHYGAFRVGSHDDLVTALGLAVQRDLRGVRFIMAGRVYPSYP